MDQRRGLRGCALLIALLLLLGAIYFFLIREAEDSTPGQTAPAVPMEEG